ncbi:MAG: XRE family transcriptional regulator, partial [Fimbriimonadales bacterium]|nr:XRE family transcriptional regulator [Fimbriimonadales bacterium]
TSLGHKIRLAREEALMSQSELAEQLGVSQSMVSQYELDKVDITVETLTRIADVLNKPISYFFTNGDTFPVSETDLLIRRIQEAVSNGRLKIPILGKVPAGDWHDAGLPEAVDYISLDESLGKQAHFALVVEGMSMHPTIMSGDLVLVQQGRLPKNRDIVVVRNENGEATLKRYINIKGRVFLKPDNPAYGEPTSEVGILVGVVIGVVRYLVGSPK